MQRGIRKEGVKESSRTNSQVPLTRQNILFQSKATAFHSAPPATEQKIITQQVYRSSWTRSAHALSPSVSCVI
jgi:hypothetical protein